MRLLLLTVLAVVLGLLTLVLGQGFAGLGGFGGGAGGPEIVPYEVDNPVNTRIRNASIFAAILVYFLSIDLINVDALLLRSNEASPSTPTAASPVVPTLPPLPPLPGGK